MKFNARFELTKLFDMALINAYKQSLQEAERLKTQIKEAFYKTPEGSILNKSGTLEALEISASHITVRYAPLYGAITLEDVEQPFGVKTYMDPSVLNTILHGKILSDEEKRNLLVEQGYLPKEFKK